jgi:hypothetical protein
MVNKSTERRLAAVEQRLTLQTPTLHEIIIYNGLVEGIAPQARIVGGQTIQAEPGESFEDFRQRVRVVATADGAKCIVFGGLPDGPVQWATPPGQEEALAAAGMRATDEIDVD